MKAHFIAFAALALLTSGCASVISDTRVPMIVQGGAYKGEEYDLRTLTLQGRNGPYTQTQVVYRGVTRPCLIDSPTDCDKIANQVISDYPERFFF